MKACARTVAGAANGATFNIDAVVVAANGTFALGSNSDGAPKYIPGNSDNAIEYQYSIAA